MAGHAAEELIWRSPNKYRLILRVDCRGLRRSNCPAAVDVDFAKTLADQNIAGEFDEHTIEVMAFDEAGLPEVFDASRPGYERNLLPWRLQKRYPSSVTTLSFVVPSERCRTFAVHFDTVDSKLGRPDRYSGLVGDGDFFREGYGRRPIGACHFDSFCDLDRDGDLDLFQGGVEPFISCLENVGSNRFVRRGLLTSGGDVLKLPCNNANNRSWVVPHFCDWDGDGDQDFLPSFMDGPYAGKIAWFENTTTKKGPLTFVDRGPLVTVSGTPVAGGKQAGGWFPSAVFVRDFDRHGDGRIDLIVGTNNHLYLYRNLGPETSRGWRLDEAVALQAGGEEIVLFNPCLDAADVDRDGDDDLFVSPQSGQVYWFENLGSSPAGQPPRLAGGAIVAYDERYLQRSTHPRVKVVDVTGDGLLDLVVDRAWELADLNGLAKDRDYGALFMNVGDARHPKWTRADSLPNSPHTMESPICDAVRQNVVRGVDWDHDGRTDLLAGDCDGFVWWFQNETNNLRPIFAPGRRLLAGGELLSRAGHMGHARHDVVDWDHDGLKDLVVSDGEGLVTVYRNIGSETAPVLAAGRPVQWLDANGGLKPIDRGTRSHVLVCDWDRDGKNDLVFSDQENPGYYFFKNVGTNAEPVFGPARSLGLTKHVRPNLGSFVDWDGDGKEDLITCEFEHCIRLYRNVGSGRPGDEPKFDKPQGEILLKPDSIMMISGVDAIDWNQDGDLDILTGQGHGGSGLRFYERDYIESRLHDTHPTVEVVRFERGRTDFLSVVRRYADAMIEHGRDTYGEQPSGLLLSALDRHTLRPLTTRPAPPGGIRREDRAGLPWLALTGANPQLDENLLRVLYTLSDLTGDRRYAGLADHEIQWFFEHTQSAATGLLPWGEHLSWDVFLDCPISGSTDLTHEFSRPWVLWDRTFQLAPSRAVDFALGLWNHQIANRKTGAFDRHAPYDRHGPVDGKDFPRHAAFYIHTWAHAYKYTRQNVFLRAIETELARYERKRSGKPGVESETLPPLDLETAAALVPDPLCSRLRAFADREDQLILAELRKQFGRPDGSLVIPPTWKAGYSSGTSANWAMFGIARWEQVAKSEFRDLVLAVADAYVDSLPDEDVDVWPMSFGHAISAEVAAYRLTQREHYLEQACRFAQMAVDLYFQDSALPRASLKTDHYETITGADSLALALLEVHAAVHGLAKVIPANTIDR